MARGSSPLCRRRTRHRHVDRLCARGRSFEPACAGNPTMVIDDHWRGIASQLNYVSEAATNLARGVRQLTREASQLTAGESFAMKQLFSGPEGTLQAIRTWRHGRNLSADAELNTLERTVLLTTAFITDSRTPRRLSMTKVSCDMSQSQRALRMATLHSRAKARTSPLERRFNIQPRAQPLA